MTPSAQREEDLFEAARKIRDQHTRRAYLDSVCTDTALKKRVESLIAAEMAAEQFFEEGSCAVGDAELPVNLAEVGSSEADPAVLGLLSDEPVGSKIGRYKLLQKLGEGGCGVVYLAEQEEPVRRRVALKVIKLGMETKSVIARFEAERQALAMMDHPNIARVFDAGATERGRPYFVMELVRGVRITDFCDQDRLTIRARLDLFVQVCHAIQHAHQKGIIHGDIKPSNILVTLHDGAPVPKVIDFGISKATEARLADQAMFTAYAQLVGTPAYMSPEQAEMSGLDIDTRSDIYSLGVLLYELLTGRTPFDGKALVRDGLDEMRRILREVEPPRPSASLGGLDKLEATRTADARCAEVGALFELLKGDLDWVVMKALEKERGRRYETSNGLATDVQRYLNNEPVTARPPSRMYRFRKLVRRNRVMFAAGGAVAAALIAGTSTSTYLLIKEREARQRAVAAEQQQARLREEAEIRERVTQAAFLVSQERHAEADAALEGISISQPTVEGAAVFRALGEWYALRGEYARSANWFGQLLQVHQLDGADTTTLDFLRGGPVLIESGDLAGYDRFRHEALARFVNTNCQTFDRIVKIALLSAAPPSLLAGLETPANITMVQVQEAEEHGDNFQAAWRSVSLALYAYRKGKYDEAIAWSRRCLGSAELNAPRNATARLVLAMALQRKGDLSTARHEVQVVRELLETRFKGRLEPGSPVQGFWFDWLFARILFREASSLI